MRDPRPHDLTRVDLHTVFVACCPMLLALHSGPEGEALAVGVVRVWTFMAKAALVILALLIGLRLGELLHG